MVHIRNTPSLYNSAYNASFGWTDSGAYSLEAQHRIPMFNEQPIELGYHESLLPLMNGSPEVVRLVLAAYGDRVLTTQRYIESVASFVRTLSHPEQPFDRYLFYDEKDAVSAAAMRGMDLFFSRRLGCSLCHASINLSGPITQGAQKAEPVFHVMGVSDSTEAFRAPSLRMVRFSAPYMHDGSVSSLVGVIDHYQAGGIERAPTFQLSEQEKEDLIKFLEAI
jgi:cytochrome c peroxidase